ncbi:hypothetical protein ANCCAN_08513 [Ancylostoma caninum]|uniref:Uncharacterized protein n=1 Tax=Ancylostoma caninum TaxID=29170 RepID=A0A368GM24_ANCCA|nr:hypothetical protein ANCCAN_08513 [Ancylostoma caninum]
MAVLSKSNRMSSPNMSRRGSSALQILPDMDNLSETERQHIQNVLEKAEQRTPYVIRTPLPHQMTARTESSEQISLNLSQNSQDDDYDTQIRSIEDAIRKVEKRTKSEEKEDVAQQDSSKPLEIRDIDTEIDLTAVTSREIKAALQEAAAQEPLVASSQKKESREESSRKSSVGSSMSGIKSFFGKASQAVMGARDALSTDVQKSSVDESKASAVASSGELTAEELEHIQKIARLAEQEMNVPYPVRMGAEAPSHKIVHEEKDTVHPTSDFRVHSAEIAKPAPPSVPPTTSSQTTEITQEELEHINRITQMAMREDAGLDERDQMHGSISSVSARPKASPVTMSTDKQPSSSSSSLFQFKPLTGFGMRAFKNVINKAEEAKQTLEGMTLQKTDEPAKPESPRSTIRDETPAQLTQEELDHINRINELAMQEEGSVVDSGRAAPREPEVSFSMATTSEVTKQPSTPFASQPQQTYSASGTSELTQEELDHINRITQLAVQDEASSTPLIIPQHRADADSRRDFQKTTGPSVLVPSEPRKTELGRAEDTDGMILKSDRAGQIDAPVEFKPTGVCSVVEETSQLTQEELEHIARINQMAIEAEAQLGGPILKSQRAPPTAQAVEEATTRRSSTTKSLFGRSSTPEQPRETQTQPKTTTSSFGMKPFTGFGLKTFKEVMHKAEEAKSAFGDLTASKSMKRPESGQVIQQSGAISPSRSVSSRDDVDELTQEELDHINRITQMAIQDGADQFPAQVAPMPPQVRPPQATIDRVKEGAREALIPEVPVEFKSTSDETVRLTQEELDHIARVNQMAMEAEAQLAAPTQPHRASVMQQEIEQVSGSRAPMQMAVDDQLTQEELDHIALIAQLADQDQGALIPASSMGTTRIPSEEVTRIQQQPASPLLQTSPFGGFGLKTFKNVKSKAEIAKSMLGNVSATVRGQPTEVTAPVAESITEKKPALEGAPGLTQEKLDHISRVTELALQEERELTLQEHPHIVPLTPEEPRQFSSPETDEGPDSPASAEDEHYAADESAVDEHYIAEGSAVDDHYGAERAAAEAGDEHVSPASSHESPRGSQRTVSRGSSGFDILSIPEMLNNPNLSQWYEEKLSFMKESIADEENEAEAYSREDLDGKRHSQLLSGYHSSISMVSEVQDEATGQFGHNEYPYFVANPPKDQLEVCSPYRSQQTRSE